MRWINPWLAALLLLLVSGRSAEAQDKRIAVFSPSTSFTLPVVERDGRDYVGLLEVLEPVGTVKATQQSAKWKLRFDLRDCEFADGQTQAKLEGKTFTLTAPFRFENGRGLVPVAGLGALVQELTAIKPVVFHEEARRLFVGKVAVRFTQELRKDPSPTLVLTFTSPVSPTIASEPGKVRLTFTREPIMPPTASYVRYDDPVISTTQYEESNGASLLTVFAAAPLYGSFSNEGRTLTLSRAPKTPTAGAAPSIQPPVTTAPLASGTVNVPPAPATPPASVPLTGAPVSDNGLRHFFAVIDAGHGGSERGAGLSDQLAEKDVCLSFARHLLKALQGRGISALILRDADVTLSLDQRASLANSAHPAIYIALHAAAEGRGVRVYTALIPYSANAAGAFQPWEAAQAPYVRVALVAATSVATELRKRDIPSRVLSAPLRPLNNIVAPAIAVEVSSPDDDLPDLVAPNYQQSVAAGIADGVAIVRAQLEAGR